jgi:hypothetical protein
MPSIIELKEFIEHNKKQTEALKKLIRALEKSRESNRYQNIKIGKEGKSKVN